MNNTVGILNYKLGNLLSIKSAVEYLNYKCKIIDNLNNLEDISCIIFPGVGAFDEAINYIDSNDIRYKILDIFKNKKNIKMIGICLGMQIAFDKSEESILNLKGLGIFSGTVKKFDQELNPPLNGWAKLQLGDEILLKDKYSFLNDKRVYFTHSYYCETKKNDEIAYIKHKNFMYSALTIKENFIGLQFHPEKSGPAGIEILEKILVN